MTVRQYLNYNFNTFFFIFCIIVLSIIFLNSCAPDSPAETDEDFMEKYVKAAELKFEKEKAHMDSIAKHLDNKNKEDE